MSSKKPAGMRALQRKPLLIFYLAGVFCLLLMTAIAPTGLFYRWVSSWEARSVMASAPPMEWHSEHFIVRYDGEEHTDAQIVAEAGEAVIEQVHRDFGLKWNPREKISVIVMNDRLSLSRSLGLGTHHSVLGAYFRGVIWILAPHVWLPDYQDDDPESALERREIAFRQEGPMVHELTHLVLDRRTQGRIPAWLNEGLAQYEEYLLNGWEWIEPANRIDQQLYTLDELNRSFDSLENQALSYRQSYLFIRFLVDTGGSEILEELLDGLQAGKNAQLVLEDLLDSDWRSIEWQYRKWLETEVMEDDRAYFGGR